MNSLSISIYVPDFCYIRLSNKIVKCYRNENYIPFYTIKNGKDQLSPDWFLHAINPYDLIFAYCSMYNLFKTF